MNLLERIIIGVAAGAAFGFAVMDIITTHIGNITLALIGL